MKSKWTRFVAMVFAIALVAAHPAFAYTYTPYGRSDVDVGFLVSPMELVIFIASHPLLVGAVLVLVFIGIGWYMVTEKQIPLKSAIMQLSGIGIIACSAALGGAYLASLYH